MKLKIVRTMLSLPLLGAMTLSAGTIPATTHLLPNKALMTSSSFYFDTVRRRKRSKNKSAAIIGGSALGGAVVGHMVGGKKGTVVGGLAGAGAGTVYDQETKQK